MKRTSTIFIGVTLVGIGCYVAFGMAKAAEPAAGAAAEARSDTPADAAREAAALRARMARLDAEVAALRKQMAAGASAGADARAADAEPVRRAPEARARQEAEWHARMKEIDARFRSEAADPAWASSTASALQSAATESDAMRGALRSVECRSQTCRVEIDDDRSGAVSKDLPVFVQRLAETLPRASADHIEEGNGHVTMVLYMTRVEGHAEGQR